MRVSCGPFKNGNELFWFHDMHVALRLAMELLASQEGLQFIVAKLVK
jgi:hypothetical protein